MLASVLGICLLLAAIQPQDEVQSVLNLQVAAWNAGDIPRFMDTYEQAETTTFMGTTLTRGHAQVLARYTKKYPNREAMGTLRFSDIETRMLGPDAALVIGQFHLTRSEAGGGSGQGRFTLILRKTAKGWKIIHDHTS